MCPNCGRRRYDNGDCVNRCVERGLAEPTQPKNKPMSTPNDNQHTWGADGFCVYCPNVHRTDRSARSTCSDGFKCKGAAQPNLAAVEQALAERQANSEKINATVQAARASATQPPVGHLRHTRDILRQTMIERDALQAQRDELLAAITDFDKAWCNNACDCKSAAQAKFLLVETAEAIARATEGAEGPEGRAQ